MLVVQPVQVMAVTAEMVVLHLALLLMSPLITTAPSLVVAVAVQQVVMVVTLPLLLKALKEPVAVVHLV